MIELKMPFETDYFCEICGWSSDDPREIQECEAVRPWQEPGVRIGERVRVFEQNWVIDPAAFPFEWTVKRLFYASRGCVFTGARPDHHELCVQLERRDEGQERYRTLRYTDFLLWQEGDREKLEAAGLIKPEA